jgi:hypothetical protein
MSPGVMSATVGLSGEVIGGSPRQSAILPVVARSRNSGLLGSKAWPAFDLFIQ